MLHFMLRAQIHFLFLAFSLVIDYGGMAMGILLSLRFDFADMFYPKSTMYVIPDF